MKRWIAEVRMCIIRKVLAKCEYLLFVAIPIGKMDDKDCYSFVSAMSLENDERLSPFIKNAFANKPEIRRFILRIVAQYLSKYEMEKNDFVRALYNVNE